jgi:hypothetical protein
MRYEIRPLDLGGILDEGIKLAKNHFGLLFSIVLCLHVPYSAAQGFANDYFAPKLPPNPTIQDVLAANQVAAANLKYTLPLLAVGIFLVVPLTNAAIVRAIADCYLEQPASVGRSFGFALRKAPGLLWTWVLVGLAMMGGFLLCIIPGIIAAFWFGLATQVVVLEGISGFGAMKRSRFLMKGNIGTFFVLGILINLIVWGIQLGSALIPQIYVKSVVAGLLHGVATVVASAVVVVFYFSCRCKNEQFDLTLLAAEVGADSPEDFSTAPDADFR